MKTLSNAMVSRYACERRPRRVAPPTDDAATESAARPAQRQVRLWSIGTAIHALSVFSNLLSVQND